MLKEYEENIIAPAPQFQDKPKRRTDPRVFKI